MSEKISKEKELYRIYASKVNSLLSDEEAREIFESLSNGKNSYMRIDRVESSSFDLSWIDMIEQCIPDLGMIVTNPRLTTKTTQDLVPVELARKTNADSVKHLASHTQFIKEITDEGDVIPNKVLNIGADDEIKTYENRFIATLIKHLVLFVEKRYEYISRYATLHNHEILYFKNSSNVMGSDVNIETKVTVVSPKTDKVSMQNNEYIKRIEQMRQYILYFYNSKFMKAFKNERDVRNPILQTNIIRKNVLYHHCYEVYRFLEAYDRLGVNYKVDEQYSEFNDEELHELECLVFANYLAVQGKDKSAQTKEKVRTYKPKILTSSDDEAFVYGPILKGPIEFLRVDEAYQRYLDSLVSKDIPDNPNSHEKEYYSQEIDVRKLTRQAYEEKIKLIERKKWQKIQFDKDVLARIKEREKEEERLRQERIEAKLKEEEDYLRAFRQRIVDDALHFNSGDKVEDDEIYTMELPNEFSSAHGNISLDDLSPTEKELVMQQFRLSHEQQQNAMKNEEYKGQADNSYDNGDDSTNAIPEENGTSENDLPVLRVLPIAPSNRNELLTAGLEDDGNNYDLNEIPPILPTENEQDKKSKATYHESEDMDGTPKIKPIPVPVQENFDDDRDHLNSEEKKAVLLYDLFDENTSPAFKKKSSNGKNYPDVPFELLDEDILDPFERIRALNKAYKDFTNQYKQTNVQVEEKSAFETLTEGLLGEKNSTNHGETYIIYNSMNGYYGLNGFVKDKNLAFLFSDYDEAIRKSIEIHGKVIKN